MDIEKSIYVGGNLILLQRVISRIEWHGTRPKLGRNHGRLFHFARARAYFTAKVSRFSLTYRYFNIVTIRFIRILFCARSALRFQSFHPSPCRCHWFNRLRRFSFHIATRYSTRFTIHCNFTNCEQSNRYADIHDTLRSQVFAIVLSEMFRGSFGVLFNFLYVSNSVHSNQSKLGAVHGWLGLEILGKVHRVVCFVAFQDDGER